MKRLAVFAVLAVVVFTVPAAMAQKDENRDHIEAGAFADYLRLHNAGDANFWGVGGRFGVGVAPHVNLEASMAYDFERQFTTTFSTGGTTTFVRSGLRLWHGLFGPKIWVGSKHARLFGEVKGGFLNFSVSSATATSGFTNAVSNFGSGDTNGVLFPGGGVEVGGGPLWLRVDVGDMMYFDNGANHNLVFQVGPSFHF